MTTTSTPTPSVDLYSSVKTTTSLSMTIHIQTYAVQKRKKQAWTTKFINTPINIWVHICKVYFPRYIPIPPIYGMIIYKLKRTAE